MTDLPQDLPDRSPQPPPDKSPPLPATVQSVPERGLEPRDQPRLFIATSIALGLSTVMCVLTLFGWILRTRRRAA